jgi:transcriptional regulator with XRE-family HTH domain
MKAASDGVGARLKKARAARGLTMDQLAVKVKMAQSTISSIETGKSRPSAYAIERLAWALNVDSCWLAYGKDPKPDFAAT